MLNHRYAQARLRMRQVCRHLELQLRRKQGHLTVEELREYHELGGALGPVYGENYGTHIAPIARALLGCQTKMPGWLIAHVQKHWKPRAPVATYHHAAIRMLVLHLIGPHARVKTNPSDWRQRLYPIYLSDAAYEGRQR